MAANAVQITLGCEETPVAIVKDTISIVGSSYFQPIADLVDKLLKVAERRPDRDHPTHAENGYAAAVCVLLVALLESYTARVRFKRGSEITGTLDIPSLLGSLFPGLPTAAQLPEVFLLRNMLVHNHVWHLDNPGGGAPGSTIAAPRALGFSLKKTYDDLVDVAQRRTVLLGLSAVPTEVGLREARIVFEAIWKSLEHMSAIDHDHTPLGGRTVGFRGQHRQFDTLLNELSNASGAT